MEEQSTQPRKNWYLRARWSRIIWECLSAAPGLVQLSTTTNYLLTFKKQKSSVLIPTQGSAVNSSLKKCLTPRTRMKPTPCSQGSHVVGTGSPDRTPFTGKSYKNGTWRSRQIFTFLKISTRSLLLWMMIRFCFSSCFFFTSGKLS